MCYMDGVFYILQRGFDSLQNRLNAYSVSDESKLTQLDSLDLDSKTSGSRGVWWPRADHWNQCVYVPCEGNGLIVVRWNGTNLVKTKALTCVTPAVSVAPMSSHHLYAGDGDRKDVCVVDIAQDKVIKRLSPPKRFEDRYPLRIAVLGDNVLVGFEHLFAFALPSRVKKHLDTLVLYKHESTAPVKFVQPKGMQHAEGIGTDGHSKFLVADRFTGEIFVIYAGGHLSRKIVIPDATELIDVTVADGKLWVGSYEGGVFLMSPKSP